MCSVTICKTSSFSFWVWFLEFILNMYIVKPIFSWTAGIKLYNCTWSTCRFFTIVMQLQSVFVTVKRNIFLIHPLMKLLTVEENKNGNSFHNYFIFLLKSDDHEYNKNIVFSKMIYMYCKSLFLSQILLEEATIIISSS